MRLARGASWLRDDHCTPPAPDGYLRHEQERGDEGSVTSRRLLQKAAAARPVFGVTSEPYVGLCGRRRFGMRLRGIVGWWVLALASAGCDGNQHGGGGSSSGAGGNSAGATALAGTGGSSTAGKGQGAGRGGGGGGAGRELAGGRGGSAGKGTVADAGE